MLWNAYTRFTSTLCKVTKSESAVLWIRQLSSSTNNKQMERKININGVNINYVKVGIGDHPVLLLPGVLGTIWTDFKPQVENLNRDKFTVIAWDLPGYGKSRPPDRDFSGDFYQRDAIWAYDLMKNLGYLNFSLIGWSDGGITSLMLASMHPKSIRKMVVFGANSYIHPDEIKLYERIRDINSWSEKMRAPMIQAYGEDYFKKTWSDWIDAVKGLYEKQNGDLCKKALPNIKCPTLIIHGNKDVMVLLEHPIYLKENIADSKLHIFEKGAHNLHLRYPDEFNKLVTDFLSNESKM